MRDRAGAGWGRGGRRALGLALPVLVAATAAEAGPDRLRFAPPSAWVQPLIADLVAPAPAETRGGIDYLLVDDQVRTGPGAVERYHHQARRLLSPRGVENGSQLEVEFDPGYQQLILHSVSIHRAGDHLDALRRDEVRLVQREPDLDRRLYDGRVTAVLFLRDVRQGDVVEAAWTVRGANPVFGGRWAGRFVLGYGVPVRQLGVRLVGPAARPLAVRVAGVALAPAVTRAGDLVDRRFRRSTVEAIDSEESLPAGVEAYPFLEASEWGSWDEVRSWATALFAPQALPPATRPQLDGWRALPDEASRAQAALRLVQDEVRYLGMELGVNSHRPHTPAEVLARGFGDCKDKSLLLVALLRALGLAAAPALVDTDERGSIDARLPSPLAFDHAIVRVTVGGRAVWLEPTRSLERAPLAELEPPPYQRALVLAAGESGLAAIPEPGPAPLEVVSTYQVASFPAPVALEVVTIYSGRRAVRMRHRLAEGSVAELQKSALEYYLRLYPKATLAQPLRVTDLADADHLVVTEHYQLPAFGAGERESFEADSVQGALELPRSSVRTLPLRIEHPVVIRERVQVNLPGPPDLDPDEVEVKSKASRLTRKAKAEGNGYHVDFEYRSLAPELPAVELDQHLEAVHRMRELTNFTLRLGVAGRGDRRDEATSPWVLAAMLGFLVGAGLLVVGGLAFANGDLSRWREAGRNRARWKAFRAKFELDAGEGPAKPIAIRSPAEAAAAAARLRCRCGAALAPPEGPPQAVRFDGQDLVAHALACGRCGTRRQAYFVLLG